jgi:hypothetical protein
MLASVLGVLLGTRRMLFGFCVISFAMMFRSGAVRLGSIFMMFGRFIVFVSSHRIPPLNVRRNGPAEDLVPVGRKRPPTKRGWSRVPRCAGQWPHGLRYGACRQQTSRSLRKRNRSVTIIFTPCRLWRCARFRYRPGPDTGGAEPVSAQGNRTRRRDFGHRFLRDVPAAHTTRHRQATSYTSV